MVNVLNATEEWLICSLVHKFGASEDGDIDADEGGSLAASPADNGNGGGSDLLQDAVKLALDPPSARSPANALRAQLILKMAELGELEWGEPEGGPVDGIAATPGR